MEPAVILDTHGPDQVRNASLRATSIVVGIAIVVISLTGAWAVREVTASYQQVERETAQLRAYRHLRAVTADQAYSEASYLRAPNPETRDRLERSLDAMAGAVAAVQAVGTSTDRALAERMLALDDRYAADVRSVFREVDTPPAVRTDDRAAGPALDAIVRLTNGAVETHEANLSAALQNQRSVIRRLRTAVPLIGLAAVIALGLAWSTITRRHRENQNEAARSAVEAMIDPLTELPNRRAFDRRLAQIAGNASAEGALLLIDLDGFKSLNDLHGHPAGDAALATIAQRFKACLRDEDLVARIGGDEFAVIASGRPDLDVLSDRLLVAASEPMTIDGETCQLGASIGTAVLADHDPSSAVRSADAALYAAKRAGGHRATHHTQATG